MNMKRGSYLVISLTVWILLVTIVCLLETYIMLPQINRKKITVNNTFFGIKNLKKKQTEKQWKFIETNPVDFENFDNYSGNPEGCYIVPNIIHFIRFNPEPISFTDMICYLSAVKNQKPDYLLIHYDANSVSFTGKYWDLLMNDTDFRETARLIPLVKPLKSFYPKLDIKMQKEHASNLLRLEILMESGGIFLDNDIYLVRSLNNYRRYEMVVGSDGWYTDNRIIIAHKDARLLPIWLNTYRKDFKTNDRFYNKIISPSALIKKYSYMVHAAKNTLKIVNYIQVYNPITCWKKWCDWPYALHLRYPDKIQWNWRVPLHDNFYSKSIKSEHFPKYWQWNVNNTLFYFNAFRDMVLHVYNPKKFTELFYCHDYT